MELTREEALRLHRQMWSDMKEALGDCPSHEERKLFKERWCRKHTPKAMPRANCYLCEYIKQISAGNCSDNCPIDWGYFICMYGKIDYRYSPISDILALPERREN